MGWWSRTPSTERASADGDASSSTTTTTTAADNPPPPPSPQASIRDEQAEHELKALLNQLDNHPPTTTTHRSQTHTPDTTTTTTTTTTNDDPASPIHPTRLLPTTLSCRQSFDLAFYCQSLGGQFTNIYRHGTMRDCSQNWSQFRFCMRMKNQPEPGKSRMIREFFGKRAEKYSTGPSSEDVWEVREWPVERAFGEDPDGTA
ncbi:MAG: hypothetical protein M1840_000091 [Geoglossum simile]|nr:MAG: hypothetical protein M1840_000091 [Geoglossum simile]